MKVREIMTADPRTAEPDTTLEEIATMMKEEDVGVIPVLEDGRVTGVVTDRDIVVRCIAEGKDATELTAEDVMSAEVRSIEPDSDVDDAADIMSEAQVRRLPVVKGGKLVGMLSLGDIAVKAEDEEETTAETLEEVSEGVKGKRGQQAGSDSDADAEDMDEESEFEMAGSGARRGQQSARGQQQDSRGQNSGGRQQQQSGRNQQNGRNQQSGRNEQSSRGNQQNSRGNQQASRGSGNQQKKGAQGISNRSAKQENARQAKVAPKRADAGGKRNSGRRRAS
jgi:CBS domain-containing protein